MYYNWISATTFPLDAVVPHLPTSSHSFRAPLTCRLLPHLCNYENIYSDLETSGKFQQSDGCWSALKNSASPDQEIGSLAMELRLHHLQYLRTYITYDTCTHKTQLHYLSLFSNSISRLVRVRHPFVINQKDRQKLMNEYIKDFHKLLMNFGWIFHLFSACVAQRILKVNTPNEDKEFSLKCRWHC